MTKEELFNRQCLYACEVTPFEDYHSMPKEEWYEYVREHYISIPKSELEIGKEYNGICRNSNTATWDGKVFWYPRTKFNSTFNEKINHYEDDDGFDVFVPIKEN